MIGLRITIALSMATTCVAGVARTVPRDHPTIQDCIDASIDGDECVVSPGVYPEIIDFLGKAIMVRSEQGASVTTIDASGLMDSAVKCISGEGAASALDGFTIFGGTGSACPALPDTLCGGGMYCRDASPTVTDCVFAGNSAQSNGGGMYNLNSHPTMLNCRFEDNTAERGGGVYNLVSDPHLVDCAFVQNVAASSGGGMFSIFSMPQLRGCSFVANVAQSSGGGGMFNGDGAPEVIDGVFRQNLANFGGGMQNNRSVPTISGTLFQGNSARFNGGGIYNSDSDPEVARCTFDANVAARGGGMNSWDSRGTVVDCTFTSNEAVEGGGLYTFSGALSVVGCRFNIGRAERGGGMFVNTESPEVTGCVFFANIASQGGGGLYNFSSTPDVAQCTFSENTAGFAGGAFNCESSNMRLSNSIVWGNTADVIGDQLFNDFSSSVLVTYSIVQDALPDGVVDGGGNMDRDPRFANRLRGGDGDGVGSRGALLRGDVEPGDLSIDAGSPGIDAGDPELSTSVDAIDLAGRPRILCGRVDMGAYEYNAGDSDDNGVVDLLDFSLWHACMLAGDRALDRDACSSFRVDLDKDIDLFDYAAFQRCFTGDAP